MMKNVFSLHVKAFVVFNLFGFVDLIRKQRLISKFMMSGTGEEIITIHILISQYLKK